jgi:hypothetical protein
MDINTNIDIVTDTDTGNRLQNIFQAKNIFSKVQMSDIGYQ